MSGSASASVSVIVPTKNRPLDLVSVCQSISRQTVPPRQVIIVDQGRDTEAREAVANFYRRAPQGHAVTLKLDYIWDTTLTGLTAARNRAMEIACGDIWLFLDDDVILEPDFVQELLAVYARHPQVAGVSGVVTNYRPNRWHSRLWDSAFVLGPFRDDRRPVYWQSAQLRNSEPVQVTRLGGGLMSFRAEALRGRRFDESLVGVSDGEDVDFCFGLGPQAVLMIAPKARLVHNSSPIGRSRDYGWRRDVKTSHFLYTKYLRRGIKNRIFFGWLNFGYALLATFGSLRRWSLAPWRSLLGGMEEGRSAGAKMQNEKANARPNPAFSEERH